MSDSEDRGPFLTIDQLPQPWRGMMQALSVHDDHPARSWFERIGNGLFEDDHAARELPGPHPIYRFRRGELAAYVWEIGGKWFVRPWQRMRGRVSQAVVLVSSLGAALDELVRPPHPWWQFW
ncbi:hypothetical protein [Tuwongella immobilis]|uniref:Uncharacterized protein n=1 Tax=Tuwongella immobilis TaxID=692036 RepID=A0A6C2YLJ0_9BACT|nr:hypothetical protein [Tuwongella immobilis]VIP01782.1 unnamed protein product [Tuwongella immobilis]VTR99433.1 unnamed protein product [Tuwongella immobilis]